MTTNTISLSEVVTPGIRKHFVESYKERDPMLEKIFKIDGQESQTDTYENYTGLGEYSVVPEGQEYDEDAPIKAFGSSFTAVTYGKIMPVTRQMRKYGKTKQIWNGAKMLGEGAARTISKHAASVFNNGFDSSYTCLTDGKSLFATDHTRADGGASQSNYYTGVLSDANLEAALLMLENQLGNRGQRLNPFGTTLLVPNALRKTALAITKSSKVSGSANNDINVYTIQEFYGTMSVKVWPYLTSTTAWFLLDDSKHKVTWQWAEKPQVAQTDVNEGPGFKKDVAYYKGMFEASYGWQDWVGVLGSDGTV